MRMKNRSENTQLAVVLPFSLLLRVLATLRRPAVLATPGQSGIECISLWLYFGRPYARSMSPSTSLRAIWNHARISTDPFRRAQFLPRRFRRGAEHAPRCHWRTELKRGTQGSSGSEDRSGTLGGKHTVGLKLK